MGSGSTRLFTLAESLGAVESLIEVPAPMTHASVADSPLAVPPSLVRLATDGTVVDLADGLWVLPNPSGLNAHYQLAELAEQFRILREFIEVGRDVR